MRRGLCKVVVLTGVIGFSALSASAGTDGTYKLTKSSTKAQGTVVLTTKSIPMNPYYTQTIAHATWKLQSGEQKGVGHKKRGWLFLSWGSAVANGMSYYTRKRSRGSDDFFGTWVGHRHPDGRTVHSDVLTATTKRGFAGTHKVEHTQTASDYRDAITIKRTSRKHGIYSLTLTQHKKQLIGVGIERGNVLAVAWGTAADVAKKDFGILACRRRGRRSLHCVRVVVNATTAAKERYRKVK